MSLASALLNSITMHGIKHQKFYLGLLVQIFLNSAVGAQPAHVIWRTGDPAVEVPQYTFNGFVRNNANLGIAPPTFVGDFIVAGASLRMGTSTPATDFGFWMSDSNGQLHRKVARLGEAAHDVTGASFATSMNAAGGAGDGRIFFTSGLAGVSLGEQISGLWEADSQNTRLIALRTEPATGTNPQGYFLGFQKAMGLTGGMGTDLAIYSSVSSMPGQPATLPMTYGWWQRRGQEFEMSSWSYGTFDSLPNTFIREQSSYMHPSGVGAYWVRVDGSGVSTIQVSDTVSITTDRAFIKINGDGERTLMARQGDQAPGFPVGALFRSLNWSTTLTPAISENGQIVLSGSVAGGNTTQSDNSGLWSFEGSELHLMVRANDPAPCLGENVRFGTLSGLSAHAGQMTFLENGDLIFVTGLQGSQVTLVNSMAIVKKAVSGQYSVIARAGTSLPALPEGTTFLRTALGLKVVAAGDTFYFTARIGGSGVTTTNDDVLIMVDSHGMRLVLREGDVVGDYLIRSFATDPKIQINSFGNAIIEVNVSPVSDLTGSQRPAIVGLSRAAIPKIIVASTHSLELSSGSPAIVSGYGLSAERALSVSGKVVVSAAFTGSAKDEAILVFDLEEESPFICRADFNSDGIIDPQDINAFLAAWFAELSNSDFDLDGIRSVSDIFSYLSAYFAGCE